jgi:selenophosphate synthetase-related protein
LLVGNVGLETRGEKMVKLLKIQYNKGLNAGYFIKTRNGKYIPVFIDEGVFSELKNIVEEKEVNVSFTGRIE